jgi:hypothetical protein
MASRSYDLQYCECQFRGMPEAHSAEAVGISIWTQRGRVRLIDLNPPLK